MQTLLVIALIAGLNAWLIYYFLTHSQGPTKPLWALVVPLVIGLAAAHIAGFINTLVEPLLGVYNISFLGLIVLSILPAFFEEALKLIPVVFFVQSESFFRGYTDGVIYFVLSGVGFGLYENIHYALQQGAIIGMQRTLTVLLFHAATTGIFGYWYARVRFKHLSYGPLRLGLIGLGLALLHAGYNMSLLTQPATVFTLSAAFMISLGLTLGLFWVFIRAVQYDQELDRQGASVQAQ